MAALANAAKFARDTAVGGFRDLATAALVGQARAILATPPVPADLVQTNFAKSVVRQASAWTETAAWCYAADPTIYVSATLPTEVVINAAAVSSWLALSRLAE
jgi:hypothetical protein